MKRLFVSEPTKTFLKMKSSQRLLTALFFLLINTALVVAQDLVSTKGVAESIASSTETRNQTIFQSLDEVSTLRMTITTNINELITNKFTDDYRPATISYESDGQAYVFEAKVRTRGKFRRKTCDFPPLKLKFNKNDLRILNMHDDHKSLKLVTHCLEDEEDAGQYLVKEYLAYKMLNTLTPHSFRVKFVEVVYTDVNNPSFQQTQFGFLIENTDEMAERLEGVECEDCYNLSTSVMATRYQHLLSMFQFMIGNADWNSKMMHNVKVVQRTDGKTLMVPYDFDFSGMVNAPYAKPNPDYNQLTVRQRIYFNKVEDIKEVKPLIRYFKANKKSLLHVVESCELLTKRSKKDVLKYLRSFFDILENDEASYRAFVKDRI